MSEKSQLILMAEYNQLMNQRLSGAASSLSEDVLNADKGAFFNSIIGTLNHILVGDIIWLKRFSESPNSKTILRKLNGIERPRGLDSVLFSDLNLFNVQRVEIDSLIIEWCHHLNDADLNTTLSYSNMKGKKFNMRLGDLILHLFLHQTHHRGQVTTLLSQEGVDFGDTDLLEIIPNIL